MPFNQSELEKMKRNLNPHKEARFAMWFWHTAYAASGLGSMTFYEEYLNDNDRKLCTEAVAEILKSRDKLKEEM
jgi:hypothetical protein